MRELWVTTGREGALARVRDLAADRRVPVRVVARDRLLSQARTDAPQGVLARAEPVPSVDLDDLLARTGPGGSAPLVVAFDGITDPRNLGALLRSAQGAGVTGAIVARHRSAHLSPAATKAAAGAVEHVAIALVAGIPAALVRAKELGLWIVGLAAEAERSIYELGPGGLDLASVPLLVVVGSEGRGLAPLVEKRCDVVASIPMASSLGSLNAASAGAVALFEIARQRRTDVTARGRESERGVDTRNAGG